MLDFIRGIVRPILTVAGFGVLSVMVLNSKLDVKEYLTLVSMMVAFWFATRNDNNGGNGVHP